MHEKFQYCPKMEMQFIFLLPAAPFLQYSLSPPGGVREFSVTSFLHRQPFRRLPAGRADQRFSGALTGWPYGQRSSPGPGHCGPPQMDRRQPAARQAVSQLDPEQQVT
jgi:hypothetical protein